MPTPHKGETKKEYLDRCMGDSEMNNKHPDNAERYAVCNSLYDSEKMRKVQDILMAGSKVSFDYDGALSTDKGKTLAQSKIDSGATVYIISARNDKEGMISTAQDLKIPSSRVYATGSNKAKVEKIKELGITTHYDDNDLVLKELGKIGKRI